MIHAFETEKFNESETTHRFEILEDGCRLTCERVLNLWEEDESFRVFFNSILADSEFEAFRWETPAVTQASLNRDFEFVLLESKGLSRACDDASFAKHFGKSGEIVSFKNLRGDAWLVVPSPLLPNEKSDFSKYVHLASFVRNATEKQKDELWVEVARAMKNRLGEAPVWLSTAGMGVAWLHVRLDSFPKYYGYAPYRSFEDPSA